MEEHIAKPSMHCFLRASRDPEGAGPPACYGRTLREHGGRACQVSGDNPRGPQAGPFRIRRSLQKG